MNFECVSLHGEGFFGSFLSKEMNASPARAAEKRAFGSGGSELGRIKEKLPYKAMHFLSTAKIQFQRFISRVESINFECVSLHGEGFFGSFLSKEMNASPARATKNRV